MLDFTATYVLAFDNETASTQEEAHKEMVEGEPFTIRAESFMDAVEAAARLLGPGAQANVQQRKAQVISHSWRNLTEYREIHVSPLKR